MARKITVSARLPYRLRVIGRFQSGPAGPTLLVERISATSPGGTSAASMRASIDIDAAAGLGSEEQLRVQLAQADRLLLLINRLLRWYRATTAAASVYEVTRAQVSPFQFRDASGEAWGDDLVFEPSLAKQPGVAIQVVERQRLTDGYATGGEPEVADLAIVDATAALNGGRFREAVLLCWSAIDATFTRRFEQLVDERLPGEWGEARKFLKGLDFGLRHKMTTGMRLLTGTSFFDLPDNFWDRLSESYRARNRIIHEGATASEDEAWRSIYVARDLVRAVREIRP